MLRSIICSVSLVLAAQAEETIQFARDIRPILSDRCFKCHGLDENSREAGMAFHDRAIAVKGKGIVPGDPDASLMIQRMMTEDPDDLMPPPSSNKPRLSADELAKFRAWVEQGAIYEDHWAFVSPRETQAVPLESATHPVDGLIERRFKEKGLHFSLPASPEKLLRRLFLDLIGLPPSTDELQSFLAACEIDHEKAVTTVIDALLGRPEYGERWARPWLDLARYADTNGYEKDRPRSIWPYRDWVIHALNNDMPYDQFSIEQLAGDMLPGATANQKVATGFHRNTMLNEEGGIDPLEYRFHAMVDRVATTGTIWLGLTVGCAQCHTHKFDPITHKDYYSLFALLNNADEPEMEVSSPALEAQRKRIESEIRNAEAALIKHIDSAAYKRWKQETLARTAQWTTLRPESMKSTRPLLDLMEDGSVFASGDFQKRDVYHLTYDLENQFEPQVSAIRIEAMPDERLPANGPGAAYYEGRKGDFFLSEVIAKSGETSLAFKDASIDFGKIAIGSGKSLGTNVYDGIGSSGWSTATQEGKRHELVLLLDSPQSLKELSIEMVFERHFVAALGRFRLSVTDDPGDVRARGGEISDLTKATDEALKRLYVNQSEVFEAERQEIAALRESIPDYPTTLVMREWSENQRKTFRHHRGEYLQPGEEVSAAVPAMFRPLPADQPANRLSLARWLVGEDNPLAARMVVNRAWRAFFGRGIVPTAGDFGYQSQLPSHPELLDYLAVRLMDDGWSLKSLHRLIVSSRTYQQDTTISPEALERDPENIWLARGPRFRMSGEMIRDMVLASSGLLSRKLGGPSVHPPQPSSVTAAAYGGARWKASQGESRYRRSLYTFMKRTAPFAAFLAFDGPTGEQCLPRRDRSNTPIQALTLLNDEMFIEAARALAAQLKGTKDEQLDILYQRILTRLPHEDERKALLQFYENQLARLSAGDLDAAEILLDQSGNNQRAAMAMLARAIYNLDEAITRE